MSQHDLTIGNQTFPLTRADLNLALKSLSECQSGTSDTNIHKANGVLWLDTTADPNILKMYNSGAPSNWITIGEFNVASGIFTTARLDGLSSTVSELNILDGVIATTAQLNFLVGVTSAIQGQLNARATLTTAQTLTNKTLTSPAINGAVSGDSLATQAEAEAGTNNDQLMTPLRTKQAITEASGLPSPDFTSTVTGTGTWDSNLTTVPHSLGVMPSFVSGYLVARTANNGYAIGDRISWVTGLGNSQAVGISYDATNVYLAAVNPIYFSNTTTTTFAVSDASWDFVLEVWV